MSRASIPFAPRIVRVCPRCSFPWWTVCAKTVPVPTGALPRRIPAGAPGTIRSAAAPPREHRLERLRVGDAVHLADVLAWIARPVHLHDPPTKSQPRPDRQVAEPRQPLDGDLLAQVARRDPDGIERRSIDDHDGP